MTGFIFGGDTGMTYEALQRKRKIAEQLMQGNSRPRNALEGLGSAAQSIAGALLNKKMDKRESAMRDEFDAQYQQQVPAQMRGAASLYDNPMAGEAQKKVLAAIMKGLPGFRYGTNFAPGGMAIVGEDGPEVVDLPRGSRVHPNAQTLEQYDPASQQRLLNNPEEMQPAPIDPRELLRPQSRFDDANAYQTADLDAFKMMQINPNYDAPIEHDANATESRRLQLLRRAMFADAALEDPRLAKAMTRLDNNIAGSLGALGRAYTDDDYELGRLMAEQFASAVLRGDSGAQTPEPEVKRYIKQYFPLTGETPEQVQAKKAMRREEIRAMVQSLPADARPAADQIMAEIEALKQQADVPDGSLSGGADISDEDKEFLKSLGLE